jgi:hypothetical protein
MSQNFLSGGGYQNKFLEKIERILFTMISSLNNIEALLGSSGSVSSSIIARDVVSTVADNALTTILSYTNTGSTLWLDKIVATGNVDGEYQVVIDTVTKFTFRTAEQQRTMDFLFPVPIKIGIGSIIDVKVTHFNASITGDFVASIAGHRE